MTNTIGIIGCGWLGKPLAKALLAENYKIKGSTTTKDKLKELEAEGINAHWIVLNENSIEGEIDLFLDSLDLLIINVPPSLRSNPEIDYVTKMGLLHEQICKSTVKNVVFVSSTSVYGALEGTITEDAFPEPDNESGKQLLKVETLFQETHQIKTTIIRFGGLIGPNRHPITYLAGKEKLTNGDEPINLIHLNDCIHLIRTIMQNGYWNQVFNGVYPLHPKKSSYYTAEAKKRGLVAPQYKATTTPKTNKIIESRNFYVKGQKFFTTLNY
ncbi:MAG: SDR family NAD(P)-dependent oxidoreductase [Croceitalea sp.]|nr:SDR family NAD(P)-dependent oxidoreductase [Croceitalea sp.]